MIKYRKTGHKKWKYALTADYKLKVDWLPDFETRWFKCSEGILTILNGYHWDGASGPAIDTDTCMRASLVHDAIYQAMIYKFISWKYRKKADKLLQYICIQDGMNRFRAWYFYHAVRIGYPIYVRVTGKY